MNDALNVARRNLDARLLKLRPGDRFAPPPKGWIRAIRDALGMSGPQLARRLAVTPQSISDLEKSEAAGSISLASLRKAAAAMDCMLVYAIVPHRSLESMVASRAQAIARRELGGVAHSMAIEDQSTGTAFEARAEKFIRETLKERDLWDDR